MMISVAMATYNGAQYITEQLDSIRKQTCKVDEIIIVDDCSEDCTVKLVEEYRRNYRDCNIRFYENETNLGYKKNFYKALSLCNGDIVFLCDQDDVWKENKVEILYKVLEEHSDIGVVSSAFNQIDGNGNVGEQKTAYQRKMTENELVCVPLEDLIFHNVSQGCAMAVTKEMKDFFLKYFTEEIPHDRILNVIAAIEKKCYYLNEPLFYYRIHDKNTIGLNDNIALKKKNTLKIRTHDAREAIKVLDLICKVDKNFYDENVWLKKMRKFADEHVANLEQKKFIRLLAQNFSSCYSKLKTFRGRLLDLFFCVKEIIKYREEK